jgi:hypothetical protein
MRQDRSLSEGDSSAQYLQQVWGNRIFDVLSHMRKGQKDKKPGLSEM